MAKGKELGGRAVPRIESAYQANGASLLEHAMNRIKAEDPRLAASLRGRLDQVKKTPIDNTHEVLRG